MCFTVPKSSVIDIARAAGRALRQFYREGKASWVIIPVYLPTPEAGEGEQQPVAVESPIEWLRINARRRAARILQTVKLRAFNPRAVEWQRMHAVAAKFYIGAGHLDPTDKAEHVELI